MKADSTHSLNRIEIGTARLETFSDSVLAVIITIMAFELKAPVSATSAAVRGRLPALLVYILSFTFVGIYWNNHHHLLRATTRISSGVMWANMFLLFWLSLIPVLTEWIASGYHHTWPAAAYGVVGLAAAIAYGLLVQAIVRANGRDSDVASALSSGVKGRVSLGLYAAAIPLSFVSPWISYAIYATVSIIWFVPDRRLTSRVADDSINTIDLGL